eukprot:TRINITY_DN2673_c0_g1_i1.p1 TRINITY_DN2673_c0_g1~~TRINITY_DN2673_c0_g1_i1.p1  ORF type:complete len:646 (+),score=122.36 TRINITY_DN2673_c0_g1_i1:82-2019(+)
MDEDGDCQVAAPMPHGELAFENVVCDVMAFHQDQELATAGRLTKSLWFAADLAEQLGGSDELKRLVDGILQRRKPMWRKKMVNIGRLFNEWKAQWRASKNLRNHDLVEKEQAETEEEKRKNRLAMQFLANSNSSRMLLDTVYHTWLNYCKEIDDARKKHGRSRRMREDDADDAGYGLFDEDEAEDEAEDVGGFGSNQRIKADEVSECSGESAPEAQAESAPEAQASETCSESEADLENWDDPHLAANDPGSGEIAIPAAAAAEDDEPCADPPAAAPPRPGPPAARIRPKPPAQRVRPKPATGGDPRQDLVKFSAFAPPRIEAGAAFELSIRAYVEKYMKQVLEEELRRHGNKELGRTEGSLPIREHAQVRVSLQMPSYFDVSVASPGFISDPTGQDLPTKSFIWSSNYSDPLLFPVTCMDDATVQEHRCIALITVDNGDGGEISACLQFSLNVVEKKESCDHIERGLAMEQLHALPSTLLRARRIVIMSTPEWGTAKPDGSGPYDVNVMKEIQKLQHDNEDGSKNFIVAFDRAGSSTANDADAERGPWWNGDEAEIKSTYWFYGYCTRVKTCVTVECQNFGGVLDVICIAGGPITQVEQRAMPSIIRNAKYDAQLAGIRCAINIRYMNFNDLKQLVEDEAIDVAL